MDQARDRQRDSWRVRRLREELAREVGDTDEMVEVIAEDLSYPHAYVRIAVVLREADRVDEAIDWLQRGLRAVGSRDGRAGVLVERLIELYQAVGRDADAVELLETRFTDSPDEGTYRQWRKAAERIGKWPQLREQAHRILRERTERGASFAAGTLARILLEEDDVDAAWQVVQQRHCDEPTRLAVADRRAEKYPADVIDIYRPLVDTTIAVGNRNGYTRAAQLLTTLRGLHSRIGDGAAFQADVQGLKEAHRRKRAFLAILADHGL
ncbi:tetratricopeptide repeat protein [Saccharopolyspora sp. NPDC000995]